MNILRDGTNHLARGEIFQPEKGGRKIFLRTSALNNSRSRRESSTKFVGRYRGESLEVFFSFLSIEIVGADDRRDEIVEGV